MLVNSAGSPILASFLVPCDFLHENHFPGASTCILIGGKRRATDNRFARFRAVLWCIDDARAVAGSLPANTQALAIVGPEGEFLTKLEQFLLRDPRRLPSLYVASDVTSRHAAAYARIIAAVHGLLESHHRARITRQKDGFAW